MSYQETSLVEHATLNPCSVSIARGSNGQVTGEVKAYAPTVDEAYEKIKATFIRFDAEFPFTKGGK